MFDPKPEKDSSPREEKKHYSGKSTFQESASDYLLSRLRGYGNEVGPDHEVALRGLVELAHGLTTGHLQGRYRFALPCGMGKTTAVRACLRAIHALGLPHRVTVACSKVEQLCRLQRQLIAEDGVDPAKVGLVHSYAVDPAKAADGRPGYASAPSEGHDRQFLLVTHARVKVNAEGAPRAWLSGREGDLMFYDESLVVGEALTLPLLDDTKDSLAAESAAFATTVYLNADNAAASAWFQTVVGALMKAAAAHVGDEVQVVDIPAMDEATAAAFLRLRPLGFGRFPKLASLVEQARDGVSFRVFTDQSTRRSLVSYTVSVPDSLRNVIVLDASDPVRELVHHDRRMRRAEDVVPSLARFKDRPGGLASIKRYDFVKIYFAQAASGRGATREAFRDRRNNPQIAKTLRVVKDRPGKRSLLFTFKDQDRHTRFVGDFLDAAAQSGIDPTEGIPDGAPCGRLNVLTWGMETATNDYQSCEVVLMPGVLHQRTDVMAGQFMGQVDDLRVAGLASRVAGLVKAECVHLIYQGANRGSMRRTIVVDGVSQAAPCEVFIQHSDSKLRQRIECVLPGAQWFPWREPEESVKASSELTLLVQRALEQLQREGVREISSMALKKLAAPDAERNAWQRAAERALAGTPWLKRRASFVLPFSDETAAA